MNQIKIKRNNNTQVSISFGASHYLRLRFIRVFQWRRVFFSLVLRFFHSFSFDGCCTPASQPASQRTSSSSTAAVFRTFACIYNCVVRCDSSSTCILLTNYSFIYVIFGFDFHNIEMLDNDTINVMAVAVLLYVCLCMMKNDVLACNSQKEDDERTRECYATAAAVARDRRDFQM